MAVSAKLIGSIYRLQTQYGREAIVEAPGIARQRELRERLAAGGRRQRQHARGEDAREVAEAIFRKPEQD